MKVGSLVRRINPLKPCQGNRRNLLPVDTDRMGIVLKLRLGGNGPRHEIATVHYSEAGKTYDIAVSLIEVVA